MVSDAFFPFRDGVDVGIRQGITAVVQPGGSMRDWEIIEACNEANVTMVLTGQRAFKTLRRRPQAFSTVSHKGDQ